MIWERIPFDPDAEFFKFTIDTRQTNTGLNGTDKKFAIPAYNPSSYDWWIDWGDGNTQTATVTGQRNSSNAVISKTYAVAGQYQITIRPAGSFNGWFGAFGAYGNVGLSDSTNNNKFVSLDKGTVSLVKGPKMFLPNPINEVNCRRQWYRVCSYSWRH